MESKAWKYTTLGLGILLLIAIVVAIWFFASNRGAVIVDGNVDDSALLDEQPSFVLAGERDGNGRILLIPSGRQVNVGCEANDEVLVLNIHVGGSGNRGILLCVEPDPTATPSPTDEPTSTAVPPTPTSEPEPTATAVAGDPIEPYAGAPYCDEIGLAHDDRTWHGVWNYTDGCKWGHEHKRNPHDLDHIFGTDVYEWMGGEISYPWQTFNIFDPETLTYNYYALPGPDAVFENDGKHEGNQWPMVENGRSVKAGSLILGAQWVDSARVHMHQIGGEMGALTRFHSFYQEVIACPPDATLAPDELITRDDLGPCGYAAGGGWLDFGRLNYPARGDYAPLPGDPAIFSDFAQVGPAEGEPYRIHGVGQNSLDSWQSEGNKWVDGLDVNNMLQFGFGVHFLQGESPGETNPDNFLVPMSERDTHFWCVDPVTQEFTCGNDSSASALFRVWVTVPRSLDGGQYDEDGQVNGRFTFHGYTDRYGVIVDGCTEPGLDCVPTVLENFPIGDCNSGFCKAAYRGGVGDGWDAATVNGDPNGQPLFPNGERFLKYPN